MQKIKISILTGIVFVFCYVPSVIATEPGRQPSTETSRRVTTDVEIFSGGNVVIVPAPNGFTSYDVTQAIQNKYRFFLRGTILNE